MYNDKYHGRALSNSGVRDQLYKFFHDGCNFRRRDACAILRKLKLLKETLVKQTTYLFFSCSLLVIYDSHLGAENETCSTGNDALDKDGQCTGSEDSNSCNHVLKSSVERIDEIKDEHKDDALKTKVDVRLIDFAHTVFKSSVECKTEDEGILFGLTNLIHIIESICDENSP